MLWDFPLTRHTHAQLHRRTTARATPPEDHSTRNSTGGPQEDYSTRNSTGGLQEDYSTRNSTGGLQDAQLPGGLQHAQLHRRTTGGLQRPPPKSGTARRPRRSPDTPKGYVNASSNCVTPEHCHNRRPRETGSIHRIRTQTTPRRHCRNLWRRMIA